MAPHDAWDASNFWGPKMGLVFSLKKSKGYGDHLHVWMIIGRRMVVYILEESLIF